MTAPAFHRSPPNAKSRPLLDPRALKAELARLAQLEPASRRRPAALELLRSRHMDANAQLKARLRAHDIKGRQAAQALSRVVDGLIAAAAGFIIQALMPEGARPTGERLALAATGGYGRGELAPYSDLDLLFILPHKASPWAEQFAEHMLYLLWDLGFKVGHASRTIDQTVACARDDHTIATTLIDLRLLWGDKALFAVQHEAFRDKVVAPIGGDFIELKLAERDDRHRRFGNSRYLVEPNLKDGKGGLRDLHTLYWIAKWLYGVARPRELVAAGFLSDAEYRTLRRAEDFLLSVRAGLHYEAGRAEERLTFDLQTRLAAQLGYVEREDGGRSNLSPVERFMKHYFLVAKQIGGLTRIFCAVLEARNQKKPFLLPFAGISRRRRTAGFRLRDKRLDVVTGDQFYARPVDLIRIFLVSQQTGYDIHPDTQRLMTANLKLIDPALRRNPEANRLFRAILTSNDHPDLILTRMNEAGILGRFVPDFGKIVGQMQFDMYHHFTVDAHTIHAIENLAALERGELVDDHPIASDLIKRINERDVLYLALFFHDIAKGRGGDHSIVGADLVRRFAPRFGLDRAEGDLAAWLVRYHLLMSHFAFKRDLTDPKTISDFVAQVQSPERLKLLLILTVIDIRSVGPGVWNGWKGQLLRALYFAASDALIIGHASSSRAARVAAKQQTLSRTLVADGWSDAAVATHLGRFADTYWIAENDRTLAHNARLCADVDARAHPFGVASDVHDGDDMTRLAVFCQDHHGIFYRISGALAVAGAAVVGATIHTSKDGMALDNFIIQAQDGSAFDEPDRLAGIEETIRSTLAGAIRPAERLNRKTLLGDKARAFDIEPLVVIDNHASNRSTVIEVNARDRAGLLYDLTSALYRMKLSIHSAHIATFGERAADVFYVRDLLGQKIISRPRLAGIEQRLIAASHGVKPTSARRSAP